MMLNVDRVQFRDVLDFTAPTNLDKYLKTWNASEVKSIFPYSHFKSIETLARTTEFPQKEAFFNELKQVIMTYIYIYLKVNVYFRLISMKMTTPMQRTCTIHFEPYPRRILII